MDWTKIGLDSCKLLWYGIKRSCTGSILKHGLLPGGGKSKGRSNIFFSPRNPLIRNNPMGSFVAYKFDAEVYI